MPSERFTKIFGQGAMRALGETPANRDQQLLLHVCEYIKNSDLLMWTLDMKNVAGLSQEVRNDYEASEIKAAMERVAKAYAGIDKQMEVTYEDNKLSFRRKVA